MTKKSNNTTKSKVTSKKKNNKITSKNNFSFSIIYHCDYNECYSYGKPETKCQHINEEIYNVDNLDLAKTIISDLLDVPLSEITLENIKIDFSSPEYPLSEQRAVQIKDYYNGRCALYKTILNDLDNIFNNDYHNLNSQELQYEIPEKYNNYTMDENDQFYQNNAYIKIIVK